MGLGPGRPVGEGEGDRKGELHQSHTMLCKLGAAFSLCAEKLGLREVKELPERAQPVQVELSAGPPKPKEFSPLHYTALLAREDAGRKTLGPCVRASVCVSVCVGGREWIRESEEKDEKRPSARKEKKKERVVRERAWAEGENEETQLQSQASRTGMWKLLEVVKISLD